MSHNCPTYLIVLILLAAFGYAYNRIIASLESQGHDRGYMGFIVALGCLATIVGWRLAIHNPISDIEPGIWLLACFAASGTPMIIGSVDRHIKARDAEQQALLKQHSRIINGGGDRGDDAT